MKINHKKTILWSLAAVALLAVVGLTVRFWTGSAPRPVIPEFKSLAAPATPADGQIVAAERAIKAAPSKAEGYNQLCAAYLRKERETGDGNFSLHAEAALKRSLEIDPDVAETNFDALMGGRNQVLSAEAGAIALAGSRHRARRHLDRKK